MFTGKIIEEPTTFEEAWIRKDSSDLRSGEMQARKNLTTWKIRKCGISFQKKTFQSKEYASSTNGYSR
jgi:hypothetical protein